MQTIVLSARGLGAAWLGGYGNEWIATPNLDRLAAEGVVHDHHIATGADFSPLAGFTHIVDPREARPLQNLRKRIAEVSTDLHLESDAFAEPWFAPDELMEDYGDDEIARYAAAVVYFDAEFGALRDCAPEARWVATGITGHALSREQPVHLPLIIGDTNRAGRRISSLTADADLAAILRGEAVTRNFVLARSGDMTSIRTQDWTLIVEGDASRLYHWPEDRFEVNDVARLHSDVVEALTDLINSPSPR